jgi:hypothetical protein
MATKWQYCSVDAVIQPGTDWGQLFEDLNAMGAAGWEIIGQVNVVAKGDEANGIVTTPVLLAKRQITN